MKVCESCCAKGYTERLYHGQRIQVLCDACHGAGSIALGPEGHTRWRQLREAALSRAIREGWYEWEWEGEPGAAKLVLRLVGPAEFVVEKSA